jgi:Xaa-Pro aminopeptidase
MTSGLSDTERLRRSAALRGLAEELELDALVLVSNDYRGHKGALRWVGDYNLAHRYGFALMARGGEPELMLPENLALARTGSWAVPIRYVRHMGRGLVEALREGGEPRRIGVVGLGEVMRVEDYLQLREAFPDAELVDASADFDRLRARKSTEELAGVREATAIAERCFERALECARVGVSEREVAAELLRVAYAAGGEDFLFLSMYARSGADGRAELEFGTPGDRVLGEGDQMILSLELIGPLGYWCEFARMVVLGEPDEDQVRLNAAVGEGMRRAEAALQPGARPAEVQQAVLDGVAAHGARSAYWSGHGLGQDVIEHPWIGLEVVQDGEADGGEPLEPGVVVSVHPMVSDERGRGIGYMADSYVVGEGAVSAVPLELHVVR